MESRLLKRSALSPGLVGPARIGGTAAHYCMAIFDPQFGSAFPLEQQLHSD